MQAKDCNIDTDTTLKASNLPESVIVQCYLTNQHFKPIKTKKELRSHSGSIVFRVNPDQLSRLTTSGAEQEQKEALLFFFDRNHIEVCLTNEEPKNIHLDKSITQTSSYTRNVVKDELYYSPNDPFLIKLMNYFNAHPEIGDQQAVRFHNNGEVYCYTYTKITEHLIPASFIICIYRYALIQRAIKEYSHRLDQDFFNGSTEMIDLPWIPQLISIGPSDSNNKMIFQDLLKHKIVELIMEYTPGYIGLKDIILSMYPAKLTRAGTDPPIDGSYYLFILFNTYYEMFLPNNKDPSGIILTTGRNSLKTLLGNTINIVYPTLTY
jgi:hypothetical protein